MMDTLTTDDTEAFYNDIALPPMPLVGGFEKPASAASHAYPTQVDLLLQKAKASKAAIAQEESYRKGADSSSGNSSSDGSTGSSNSSSNKTIETYGSSVTLRSGSSVKTSSSSTHGITCTSDSGSATPTTEISTAADSSALLQQQQYQQQQQRNASLEETPVPSYGGVSTVQIAGPAAAEAAAGLALPAAVMAGAAAGQAPADLSRTVSLYDQHATQNMGGRAGCFPPSIPQAAPAALARGTMDSNGGAGGVRAVHSYGSSSGEGAAGEKEVFPFAASQAQALYLLVRQHILGRTASWKHFFQFSSFELPATGAVAVDRVERNVRFFFMNYVLLCTCLAVVAVILHPSILIVAAVFGGAAALAGLHGGNSIRLGKTTVVPVKNLRYGCAVGGLVTLLFVAGQLIVGMLTGCATLVLLHAAFHIGVSYEQISQQCVDDFDCAV